MFDPEYTQSAIDALTGILVNAIFFEGKTPLTPHQMSLNGILLEWQANTESELFLAQERGAIQYWEGMRDMLKLSIQKWSEISNIPKFIAYFSSLSKILIKRQNMLPYQLRHVDPPKRRTNLSSTPFIYNFPYPKGPPAATAEGKLKSIKSTPSEPLSTNDQLPLDSDILDTRSYLESLIKKEDEKKRHSDFEQENHDPLD